MKKIIRKSITVEVMFHETDLLGIAHNSVHFKWFEQGWMAIMEDIIPISEAIGQGFSPVVIRNTCEYCKPARFKDVMILTTRMPIPAVYEGKFVFFHELTNKSTLETIATGESWLTLIDLKTYKLLKEIPKPIQARIKNRLLAEGE